MTEFINEPRMWPTCLQLVKRQIHRLIIFLSRTVRHNTHGLFPKTFCLMFNRLMELQKQPPRQACQTRGAMKMQQVRGGIVCSLSSGEGEVCSHFPLQTKTYLRVQQELRLEPGIFILKIKTDINHILKRFFSFLCTRSCQIYQARYARQLYTLPFLISSMAWQLGARVPTLQHALSVGLVRTQKPGSQRF